jgi:hypothetical protein
MRPTHELIEHFEHCRREGIFARDWEKYKLTPHQMLMEGIMEGLTIDRKDFFQAAGEKCYELAIEPGLDSKQYDLHSEVVHICALSDILSAALRKGEAWKPVEPIDVGNGSMWESDAFLEPSGYALRRVICVSSWSDDRSYSLCRSWGSLGTVCLHNLPMRIAVCMIGSHREGRYHSYWTKGNLHPINKKLRFRKRTEKGTGFKDSWISVSREDRDEISTQAWLQAMLDDGVLQDSTFVVDLPVPESRARQEINDLAARRLDEIYKTKTLPEKQLSTCDWPTVCSCRGFCHSNNNPSGKYGFVRIE